jgi:hypothetical protein
MESYREIRKIGVVKTYKREWQGKRSKKENDLLKNSDN